MTTTKHELLADRLARILMHLYQGAVLTKEQLAEEFNVTTRTIYRDLGRLGPILDELPNGGLVDQIQSRMVAPPPAGRA